MNTQNLWASLAKNNLVTGEKPQTDDVYIPWYIRFIQGFAGWLAALFIMGFFAIFFEFIFKKPTGGLVTTLGILCSIGGYVLIKSSKKDFLEQLGMAFSLCGQILFSFGLFFFLKVGVTTGAFILAAYQLILAWLLPQYAHRLLSTAFGLFALLIALNSSGFYGIGSALVAIFFSFIWLRETNWGKQRDLWEPVGLGTALTIVFSSGFLITGKHLLREVYKSNTGWLFEHAEIISSLLISLVLLNVIVTLLKEYKVKLESRTAILSFLAAAGLFVISFKIFGLSTGLLITLIGFARQRMVLIVLGVASVASFFSWYYYNLQATLLFKSVVLIILGVSLLVAWFGLNYIYNNKTEKKLSKVKLKTLNKTKWLAVATIIVSLVAINFNINKKEDLIENGEVLLLKLAPVDPRSIMQGDYMRLRFDLAGKIQQAVNNENNKNTTSKLSFDGKALVEKDENNIVTFVALYENQNLNSTQRLLPYKYRNRRVKFTTNAFYFQEGKASHFQKAEYGEFKMSEDGEILLVNMINKDLKVL